MRGANAGVADVREEALLRIHQVASGSGGWLVVSMTHVTLALASALESIYSLAVAYCMQPYCACKGASSFDLKLMVEIVNTFYFIVD